MNNYCNVLSQVIDIHVCFQTEQACSLYEIWLYAAVPCRLSSFVCKYRSYFMQFLPFNLIIVAHLYIFIPISLCGLIALS